MAPYQHPNYRIDSYVDRIFNKKKREELVQKNIDENSNLDLSAEEARKEAMEKVSSLIEQYSILKKKMRAEVKREYKKTQFKRAGVKVAERKRKNLLKEVLVTNFLQEQESERTLEQN